MKWITLASLFLLLACGESNPLVYFGAATSGDQFENGTLTIESCKLLLKAADEAEYQNSRNSSEMDIDLSDGSFMAELFDRYFSQHDWRRIGFSIRARAKPDGIVANLILHNQKVNDRGFALNHSIYLPASNSGLYPLLSDSAKAEFGVTEEDIEKVAEVEKVQMACLVVHEMTHIIQQQHGFEDKYCRYDYGNPQAYAFSTDGISSLEELPGQEAQASLIQHSCMQYLGYEPGGNDNKDQASEAEIESILFGTSS